MKSKPWIDKVYQDHLTTREIPLDLNHWAQAETLIIAQEKANKKRRVIWWSLLVVIVTGLSVLGWNQYIHSKHTEIKSITPEIQEAIPAPANPEVAQRTETKIQESKQPETNQTAINSKHADRYSPDHSSKHSNESVSINERTIISSSKNKNRFDNRLIPSGSRDLNGNPIADATNTELKMNPETELLAKREIMDIVVLNTTWKVSAPMLNQSLKMPANEISDEPIQIKKSSWKENGVRMTLAQESGLQVSNPSVQHAGFEWFHQQSIRSGLFYGYSLGYKSNFNHSQYAEVITSFQFEGFSSNVQNFGIKPEWMNALYAQGNIGINVKRNKLFLGIRPEFIIGTQGKVDQLSFKETTGIKDIKKASISPVNKGWLQSGSLNELSWTLSIGYEYRIMKNLGVGIQIDHSLKSIYRPLDPQIKQQAAAAWNTGFRFSYILN